jgi:hypothetical protein
MSGNQIIRKQVQPLPIGSPGSDNTKRKLILIVIVVLLNMFNKYDKKNIIIKST